MVIYPCGWCRLIIGRGHSSEEAALYLRCMYLLPGDRRNTLKYFTHRVLFGSLQLNYPQRRNFSDIVCFVLFLFKLL